jgi:HEAT repeat protein
MVSEHLLNVIMLIEVGLLALAVALFFLHGLWLHLTARREERLSATGREALARLVTRGHVSVEDVEGLKKLPPDIQTITFLEVSRSLSGTGKERLRFVAQQVGVVDRARKLCEHRWWTRRLRGARILSQLDVPDPLVQKLLADPTPAVRAQAAEWAASQPSVEVISAMLELLADPATQARFAVQNALLRMGNVIAGPLSAFLETHSGRAAEAGLRVAESVAVPGFLPSALRHSRADDPGVREAGAKLLGGIAGAEAGSRLVEMLGDAEANVRAGAASALGRMRYWQAGTQLAERLRDQRWHVRREAGLALRGLGAAGTLFLRRAVKGDDRFAADMAEQVLELPEAATG